MASIRVSEIRARASTCPPLLDDPPPCSMPCPSTKVPQLGKALPDVLFPPWQVTMSWATSSALSGVDGRGASRRATTMESCRRPRPNPATQEGMTACGGENFSCISEIAGPVHIVLRPFVPIQRQDRTQTCSFSAARKDRLRQNTRASCSSSSSRAAIAVDSSRLQCPI